MELKITPSGQTIVEPTALGPVANTDTKLLIYGLFQKGRVLAQDGVARLNSYLIDVLLLGRHAEFPHAGSSAGESAIANWSLVGRAMTGRHRPD